MRTVGMDGIRYNKTPFHIDMLSVLNFLTAVGTSQNKEFEKFTNRSMQSGMFVLQELEYRRLDNFQSQIYRISNFNILIQCF